MLIVSIVCLSSVTPWNPGSRPSDVWSAPSNRWAPRAGKYNVSHTAVSLALYEVDKGLRGQNVLQ